MSTFLLNLGSRRALVPILQNMTRPASITRSALEQSAFSTYANSSVIKFPIPQNYNFVRDHMEVLAAEEKTNTKKLAFWWADIVGNEVKYSYTDLVEKSKKLANGFAKSGLQRGDRIILLLPRVPEWWLLVLACIRSGIIPIPGTIMLTEKDISYRLETAKPKMIFAIPEIASKVDKALSDRSYKCIKVLCPQQTSQMSTVSGWSKFDDLTNAVNAEHQCISNSTDDTMMIYFTSGTTGMPKMVELAHGYALGHCYSTAPFLATPPDSLMWFLSDPGWVAHLYAAFFPVWYNRTTVFSYYIPPSPPVWGHVFEVLKKYPIFMMLAPPTIYRMLLHEKLPKRGAFPHLKQCATGGEPLNPETFVAWKEQIGYEIREIYGQTETAGLIGVMPGTKVKPGSFGKPMGYDIKIVDDNLNVLPANAEGHIAVKYGMQRPFLFKQYIGDPEKTAKCYRGGYYLTGDRGFCDDEGYLHFSSRSDDIIISSGYRIGPFEVESAVLAHPAVLESAAVSSPDKERGEIVKSFVVLKAEYKNHDPDKLAHEIQETVKKFTAPYKYPRKIQFLDELPKTVSGKIKRAELKKLEWSSHHH